MVTELELLDFMKETAYKPLTYQELEKHFQLENGMEFKEFLKLLNRLEESGAIYRTRNERYGIPERMNLLKGRMQVHAKGFGFLLPEEKDHPDVYIHANDMGGAMNRDTVLVRVSTKGPAGGRMEGEVVKIVSRAVTQLVGTFENHETYGFLIPDDKRITRDIFIPQDKFLGAVTGMKVVVKLISYPEGRAAAQGEVVEILGHKDDPGVDIISIIRKHMLPESFNEEVLAEAEQVPEVIREEDLTGRKDLRGKVIVTIDGEDAKDLDDAVNVERLPNGNYLLGVHIADVSYYVTENSALDREAYMRGCSVYLVDRVIPMLPHRLSNGICSLNPQVDRLTMSCEMEIDANANVVRHDIFTSVIKTTERMTYTNVRKILHYAKQTGYTPEGGETLAAGAGLERAGSLDAASEVEFGMLEQPAADDLGAVEAIEGGDAGIRAGAGDEDRREAVEPEASTAERQAGPLDEADEEGNEPSGAGFEEAAVMDEAALEEARGLVQRYSGLVGDFLLMEELALKLRRKRMRRGAIDFDFQESKILVDEQGKPTAIIKRERSIAEQIIEEFMLAANETVAEHFFWMKVPFLYRIHEEPDSEKLFHFMEFISNFGYAVRGKGNTVHPRALQTLLEDIKDTKEETVISTVLLRSMKQARYEAESMGHFGLATEFYSHFTSPIRRYPDLIIHRVIREVLTKGAMTDARVEHLAGRMADIARQSSERERVAVDAERETDALKKAEFMLDKVGEEFEGLISSVTNFGIFVELSNTVEGLIRLSDLADDYYHYHEKLHALVGERTSRMFRIGDEVKVRVARVNMLDHTIDFEMVDMKPRQQRSGGGSGGGRGEGRGSGGGGRGGKQRGGGFAAAGAGRDGRNGKGPGKPGKGGRKRGAEGQGAGAAVLGAGGAAANGGSGKRKGGKGAGGFGKGGVYLSSNAVMAGESLASETGQTGGRKRGKGAGHSSASGEEFAGSRWNEGGESAGQNGFAGQGAAGPVGGAVVQEAGASSSRRKKGKNRNKGNGQAGAVLAGGVAEGGDAGFRREAQTADAAAPVIGSGEAGQRESRRSRTRKKGAGSPGVVQAGEASGAGTGASVVQNGGAAKGAENRGSGAPGGKAGSRSGERRDGGGGRGGKRGRREKEPAPRAWEAISSSEGSGGYAEQDSVSSRGSSSGGRRMGGGFDGNGGTPFYVGAVKKRKK